VFVNCTKTNFINFNLLRNKEENFKGHIMMDESELTEVKSIKYLGIIIDQNLTWEPHINNLCNNISSSLFCLGYLCQFRHKPLLLLYYHAIIESKIRYGIVTWGSATQSLMKRIFIIQKRAIRLIQGIKKRKSCRQAFKFLQILPLYSLYIYEVIIFTKFNTNEKSKQLTNNYNIRGINNLKQESHRLLINTNLAQNIGASFFNKLPYYIKNIEDKNKFKRELKTFLIEGSFYSINEFNEFYFNQP
jgi:hypothetical protein